MSSLSNTAQPNQAGNNDAGNNGVGGHVVSLLLTEKHMTILAKESAIPVKMLHDAGVKSVRPEETEKILSPLGFKPKQRAAGILFPTWRVDGTPGPWILRRDVPRQYKDGEKNKEIKYEWPQDHPNILLALPETKEIIGDPNVPLIIVEGIKKLFAAHPRLKERGYCTIAVNGVWGWRGRNTKDGRTALADFHDVALKGREVYIVFDSDIRRKKDVQDAARNLAEFLKSKGSKPQIILLPDGPGGVKTGVDDYFASGHEVQDLLDLFIQQSTQPIELKPQTKLPTIKLLDAAPATIRRPLSLINGESYAAIWPYVEILIDEEIDKKGNIIKHDPPVKVIEQRLMIVRRDGQIFGDGGDEPMENLNLNVDLPEIPQNEKLWSVPGVKQYKNGYRPEPIHVFYRVVDVIDRFLDFNYSLADQRTMAELAACYVLATYFLDAFNIIGFLWSTGESGSGKTTFLDVICAMAYLGQVVTLGGSFASLRDMADYGACIAFDDVENLSDPKKTDPDKRSLLLAGNHRGSTIPFKELVGDKWRTRYVNTFCPRLFSAIQCPDSVLASRTIMVPLIPSIDKYKTDADPIKAEQWPHDRRKLIDDLWAMGLAYLPAIPAYDTKAANIARLIGRRLDPWRAILAVAAWLDDLGMEKRDGRSLYERMEELSWAYQTERYKIESANLTVLTIRALCKLWKEGGGEVVDDPHDPHDPHDPLYRETPVKMKNEIAIKTKAIRDRIKRLLDDENESESDDGNKSENEPKDWITSDRVGRIMGRLRFEKRRASKGKRDRLWIVSYEALQGIARSFGVNPEDDESPESSGSCGSSGSSGSCGNLLEKMETGIDDDDSPF